MDRERRCLAAFVVLAGIMPAQVWAQENTDQGPQRLTTFLRIVEENPTKGPRPRLRGVEIDSVLRLDWDELGLAEHIATRHGPKEGASKGPSKGLDALKQAAAILQEAQVLSSAHAVALVKESVSSLSASIETQDRSSEETRAALESFRRRTSQALKGAKGPDAQLLEELSASVSRPVDEGFGALSESAATIGRTARESVLARLAGAPRVDLYMHAHLVTPYGKPTQVHLEGYDKLQAGVARPFARSRMVLDTRTRQELLAAQQVIDTIRTYRSTRLSRQADSALAAVQAAFKKLFAQMKTVEVDQYCDRIIESLQDKVDDRRRQVIASCRALQAAIRPASRCLIASAPTEAAGIILFAESLNGFTKQLWNLINHYPDMLKNLTNELQQLVVEYPGVVRDELLTFMGSVRDDMVDEFDDVRGQADRLTASVNSASRSLMLMESFEMETRDLVGRSIQEDEVLDAQLDIRSIAGDRRPGDKLVVRAEICRPGSKDAEREVIEEDTETLYIEAFGGYWQSSGSLLMVDPRGSIPRNISYEPTVGLGFHYHYGIRGNDFWNRTLNPGVGLSFAMLDFDDNDRFEVGAALGVTLFNDSLWVGYGRNLNIRRDYFYLGLNPYTLTRFLRPSP